MVKNVILHEGLHILHQCEIQLASNNSIFFLNEHLITNY